MPDVARFRDSTQILLPPSSLEGIRQELEEQFVLTILADQQPARIIGSPVEIKAASEFLARHGITVR